MRGLNSDEYLREERSTPSQSVHTTAYIQVFLPLSCHLQTNINTEETDVTVGSNWAPLDVHSSGLDFISTEKNIYD